MRFWEGFTQNPFMRNPPSRENPGALVVPVGIGDGSLYDHRLDMLLLETSSSKKRHRFQIFVQKQKEKKKHEDPLQLA